MVMKYDSNRPADLDLYLEFVGMTEDQFEAIVEELRDLSIWEKGENGKWRTKDNIGNHINDPGVDEVKLQPTEEKSRFIRTVISSYIRDDHIHENENLNQQSEYVIL